MKEKEMPQTEMYIEMTDESIEDLILNVLPISGELFEELAEGHETFDDVLFDWYGVDFETYKSIIEDVIRFTNQRRTKDGKIIYEFAYEGIPLCMSPVLDEPLLTTRDKKLKVLYKAAEKNQNHKRVMRIKEKNNV